MHWLPALPRRDFVACWACGISRPPFVFWTPLAGGAGIYLGCMDVLFDLENGLYAIRPGADASGPAVEIVIEIVTFTLGASIIAGARRHRRWLLAA
jgi:hypothetical protein